MPFEKTYDKLEIVRKPACIHLRSKGMYVTGDIDSSHPDESGNHHCWCNLTQHVLGPDRSEVERQRCVVGRDCFRNTY